MVEMEQSGVQISSMLHSAIAMVVVSVSFIGTGYIKSIGEDSFLVFDSHLCGKCRDKYDDCQMLLLLWRR
jgi:hypothetical protein